MEIWRLLVLSLIVPLVACLPAATGDNGRPPLTVSPGETLLAVAAPSLGAQAPMKLVARSNGVETWMSADRYSVSLRDGVLVATRGFGFDLMSGDADATLEALVQPNSGMYSRHMRYLTSDNQSTWLRADCKVALVRTGSGVRTFEEDCVAETTEFTNQFEVDGKGRIVQSRQWVSKDMGYLEIGFARQ
jgi:hypothetical protein